MRPFFSNRNPTDDIRHLHVDLSDRPSYDSQATYACLLRISLTRVTVLAGFWVKHSLLRQRLIAMNHPANTMLA